MKKITSYTITRYDGKPVSENVSILEGVLMTDIGLEIELDSFERKMKNHYILNGSKVYISPIQTNEANKRNPNNYIKGFYYEVVSNEEEADRGHDQLCNKLKNINKRKKLWLNIKSLEN